MSSSIYRFKYAGRAEYADGYGEIVSDSLGNWIRSLKADALIPVPMYKKKERLRGYNQASVLARAIGKELNIPVRDDLILRTRNTVPMKKLDEKGRRINLKKAFKVTSNDVKLKSIIIIDDIYTTGSTIDEIAHEFRQVGVEKIYFCTLAIGQTI
jgi:ComF family protein